MKNICICLSLALFLCSCDNVPNKSVFEPLSASELSEITKSDTSFVNFYQHQQEIALKLNEIDKAKYGDITYQNLYEVYQYASDATVMVPLTETWDRAWECEFGVYAYQVDSVLSYWSNYKKEHSLNRFVVVEFAGFDKEYYTYSNDIRKVNIAFRLTPLQGKVDQIRFNYRYSAKINDFYGDQISCIYTAPVTSSAVKYWELGYDDEKRLKHVSSSHFNRDYDIKIEVTDVRKDNKNYSIADLNIPESIAKVLDLDYVRYPYLYDAYKEGVIKDILRSDYKGHYEHNKEKLCELLSSKFPREYAYLEYVAAK